MRLDCACKGVLCFFNTPTASFKLNKNYYLNWLLLFIVLCITFLFPYIIHFYIYIQKKKNNNMKREKKKCNRWLLLTHPWKLSGWVATLNTRWESLAHGMGSKQALFSSPTHLPTPSSTAYSTALFINSCLRHLCVSFQTSVNPILKHWIWPLFSDRKKSSLILVQWQRKSIWCHRHKELI